MKKQYLLQPSEGYFARLGFTDAEKQFFHEVFETDKKGNTFKRYVFNEPWRYVLRVRPNIIDKVRKRDVVIEARRNAIRDYLEWNVYQRRLDRLLYGHIPWKYDWPRRPDVYEFKNKSFSQIMDLISQT